MKTLSDRDESRLLRVVEEAVGRVDEHGEHPTDAVVKTATEHKLPRGHIKLACQAYNTGRFNAQRQSAATALEKFAEFPLADAEAVDARMFPESVPTPAEEQAKTAVAAVYSRPPTWLRARREAEHLKAARARPPLKLVEDDARVPGNSEDTSRFTWERKAAAALNTIQVGKRHVEELRRKMAAAEDQMQRTLYQLADYFKTAQYGRLPLAEVEYNGRALLGDQVTDVLNIVCAANGTTEKRASGPPAVLRSVDLRAKPYRQIADALKQAAELVDARAAYQSGAEQLRKTAREQVRPFAPPRPVVPAEFSLLKESKFVEAALGDALSVSALTSALMKHQPYKGPEKRLDDAVEDLQDPRHEAELRKIQIQSMLHDFMNNDDVIKGHDPQHVLSVYNELSQMAPAISASPAVMRPLLRRRLQSHVEPFESAETTQMEGNFRDLRVPSAVSTRNIFQSTPERSKKTVENVGNSLKSKKKGE